ncbi:MAG: DUF3261 domain-containing protein [Lysobacteraceae bacterium]
MKALRLALLLICASLLLAGCTGHAQRKRNDAPALALRLSPASLGHALALQQQLSFHFGSEERTLDALLEVDAHEVRLEIQSAGQSALRLRWDGSRLEQHRAAWLPPSVRGEEVLSDLQLAQWPVQAIRAALPAGWSLVEDGGARQLRHGDTTIETVRYPAPDRVEIEHANFRLDIVSVPVEQSSQ